jgi:hypothetical protein
MKRFQDVFYKIGFNLCFMVYWGKIYSYPTWKLALHLQSLRKKLPEGLGSEPVIFFPLFSTALPLIRGPNNTVFVKVIPHKCT